MNAAVVYEGPSLLTGDPIVVIVTGMDGESANMKTGDVAQVWILRSDMSPTDAVLSGADEAICGDCKLRGEGRFGRACYVTWWQAPMKIYQRYARGGYPTLTPAAAAVQLVGEVLRLAAYGDPVAVPLKVWRHLLSTVRGWIAYTHQWAVCDPAFARFCMASVDSEEEHARAIAAGWRTFRTRRATDPLLAREIVCPASEEFGYRVTCEQCQLCRGKNRPAKNIAIIAHGSRAQHFGSPARLVSAYERKQLRRAAKV